MTDYNGWANWETWQVNLWIDNEYAWYEAKRDYLADLGSPVTAVDVMAFFAAVCDNRTPDFNDDPIVAAEQCAAVDFNEIAEHWEVDRLEILEYNNA